MAHAVMIDGVLCSAEDAKVSIYDRGFLYGDSVFETIRTYQGSPFSLDAHWARLEASAERVFIPMPVARDVLTEEVARALHAARNPESYVRVMITRGQGALGLDPALADKPCRVILVAPLQALPEETYLQGVSVRVCRTQRVLDATGGEGAKIGNYLVSVLALREAKAVGAHEALISSGEGRVLEGATSNLFLVRDGVLLTPPVESGILAGITRAHVIAAAQRLGIVVQYEAPTLAELQAADEVAISSSIRELLAVVSVDGAAIGAGTPGPVVGLLHAEFRRAVRDGT